MTLDNRTYKFQSFPPSPSFINLIIESLSLLLLSLLSPSLYLLPLFSFPPFLLPSVKYLPFLQMCLLLRNPVIFSQTHSCSIYFQVIWRGAAAATSFSSSFTNFSVNFQPEEEEEAEKRNILKRGARKRDTWVFSARVLYIVFSFLISSCQCLSHFIWIASEFQTLKSLCNISHSTHRNHHHLLLVFPNQRLFFEL